MLLEHDLLCKVLAFHVNPTPALQLCFSTGGLDRVGVVKSSASSTDKMNAPSDWLHPMELLQKGGILEEAILEISSTIPIQTNI